MTKKYLFSRRLHECLLFFVLFFLLFSSIKNIKTIGSQFCKKKKEKKKGETYFYKENNQYWLLLG